MPGITSFQMLRQQRHARWLGDLKERINSLLARPTQAECVTPDQIYLFGSRARGDWDGHSDTDLLVVAENQADAEQWVDQLLDKGLAQDAIALDRKAWKELPNHPSVIWRNAVRDALPLLEERS